MPGLEAAERARKDAQQRAEGIKLDIRSVEAEGVQAGITLARIRQRFDNGGLPQQSDLDEEADAEAVVASIGRRVALLRGSLGRAEEDLRAAEQRVRDAIKKELGRRGARALAASEATRKRAEEEYAAGRTACNAQSEFGKGLMQQSRDHAASIDALHSALAASAEYAATAREQAA